MVRPNAGKSTQWKRLRFWRRSQPLEDEKESQYLDKDATPAVLIYDAPVTDKKPITTPLITISSPPAVVLDVDDASRIINEELSDHFFELLGAVEDAFGQVVQAKVPYPQDVGLEGPGCLQTYTWNCGNHRYDAMSDEEEYTEVTSYGDETPVERAVVSDMASCKSEVVSCKSEVASCKSEVASCKSEVVSCKSQSTYETATATFQRPATCSILESTSTVVETFEYEDRQDNEILAAHSMPEQVQSSLTFPAFCMPTHRTSSEVSAEITKHHLSIHDYAEPFYTGVHSLSHIAEHITEPKKPSARYLVTI